jgi:hypothetical protein
MVGVRVSGSGGAMQDKNRKREPENHARRPYEPPAIEQDETFETLALACAKMPLQLGCGAGMS